MKKFSEAEGMEDSRLSEVLLAHISVIGTPIYCMLLTEISIITYELIWGWWPGQYKVELYKERKESYLEKNIIEKNKYKRWGKKNQI